VFDLDEDQNLDLDEFTALHQNLSREKYINVPVNVCLGELHGYETNSIDGNTFIYWFQRCGSSVAENRKSMTLR